MKNLARDREMTQKPGAAREKVRRNWHEFHRASVAWGLETSPGLQVGESLELSVGESPGQSAGDLPRLLVGDFPGLSVGESLGLHQKVTGFATAKVHLSSKKGWGNSVRCAKACTGVHDNGASFFIKICLKKMQNFLAFFFAVHDNTSEINS